MAAPIALIVAVLLVSIVIARAMSGPEAAATILAGTPPSLTLPRAGAPSSIAPFIVAPARTVSVIVVTDAIP